VLSNGYNFVITTQPDKFYIKNSIFYFKNGKKIPIVHNAGGSAPFRPVDMFGFGNGRNELKLATSVGIMKALRKALMKFI